MAVIIVLTVLLPIDKVVAVITVLTVLFPINSVVVFIETFAPTVNDVALMTAPCDTCPTSSTSPNRMPKNGWVLAGAEEKIMEDPATVYATSGSCKTPPRLMMRFDAAPGTSATDDCISENVVQALLKEEVMSSR